MASHSSSAFRNASTRSLNEGSTGFSRHQHAEQVDAHGADRLQIGVAAFLLRHHPRRLFVNVAVGHIRQRHNFADGAAIFAAGRASPMLAEASVKVL